MSTTLPAIKTTKAKLTINASPRKVRLVTNTIKNMTVDEAFAVLASLQKKSSRPIAKLLKSACANAGLPVSRYSVTSIADLRVEEAAKFKRFRPGGKGMANPYIRRQSRVHVHLLYAEIVTN